MIPEDFEKNLMAGKSVAVQSMLDGTFPARAATSKGYITAINAACTSELLASYLSKVKGVSAKFSAMALAPFAISVRYLFNQSLLSTWSIAPKLIMVILMVSPPFLTVLGVARGKERGSI